MTVRRSTAFSAFSGRFRPALTRVVVWPVIAALLGLLGLPLVGLPLVGMSGGIAGVTLVPVCSVDGYRQVALDDQGRPAPPPGKPLSHGGLCPVCAAHAGHSPPPPVAAAPEPPAAGDRAAAPVPVAVFVPRPYFLFGRHSRAPPSLAV